jgi:bacterioferritin-associated ferredoxin
MYICSCSAITSGDLDAFLKKYPDASDYHLMDSLNIAKCCGLCEGNIDEIISEHRARAKAAASLEFISF